MSVFYVSPRGSDQAPGTESEPFATLASAIEAARGAAGERKIVLGAGKYYETSVTLTQEDSGLVIEAAAGAEVVLVGGRRVTGWEDCGGGVWRVDLPEVREGKWDFRHLFVDGGHRMRSRYPEIGALRHLSRFDVAWLSSTDGGWERKPTPEELSELIYRPGDLEPWSDITSAEITIHHQWDESLVGVASIDEDTHTVHFSSLAGHPAGSFLSDTNPKAECYIVWNTRAGLTLPGQWCLDRGEDVLYYRPLPGEDMERIEVVAPTTETIIRIKGEEECPVENITLRGLALTGTTAPLRPGGFAAVRLEGAISAQHAHTCRLEGLVIRGVGGHGAKFVRSEDVTVDKCEVCGTGAGGVYILRTDGVLVEENHIHHVGVTYPSGEGLFLGGTGHVVRHNELHDITYTAIGGGPSNSVFEANLFYNIMTVLDDGAAIYTTFAKNVAIRENVVVGTSGGVAQAYYLDEQTEGSVVERNLAINTGWPTHNHMSRDDVVRENVFVDDGPARLSFFRCERFTLERNVVSCEGGILVIGPEGAIASMPCNVFDPGDGDFSYGGDWGGAPPVPMDLADGSIIADPKVSLDGWRVSFAPDSPALGLGIQPLDLSHAGRTGVAPSIATTRSILEATADPRVLSLSIKNLGNAPASGKLLLWAAPREEVTFEGGDEFAYELAPGEAARWAVRVSISTGVEDAIVGYQHSDGTGMFKGARVIKALDA
jgi:hypothetical protein